MAGKQEGRDIVISMLPWRPGSVTAGQQTSIPEDQLWKCKNAAPDLDGMLSKRPGLTQWGQTIKSPDSSATGSTITAFSDFLTTDISGYTATDGSGAVDITLSTQRGTLQTNVGEGSVAGEDYQLSYDISALPTDASTWSIRFLFRGTNLPTYTALDTDPNTFAVRAQSASGSAKEFAIWGDGLYYKLTSDNTYAKVTDSDNAGNGAWNVIEIQCDDGVSGNTLVYMNDVLLQTIVSSTITSTALTGTSAFEFNWEVEGTADGATPVNYSTFVATPMYNDTNSSPFKAETVVAVTGYQTETNSGTTVRSVLIAAGRYIYHDRQLQAGWRPLQAKQYSNVFFSSYRTTVVWSDNNGATSANVWQWDGNVAPEKLDDAPPVQFLAEHQTRLWGWGDVRNPRRLYYTGDRKPNVWFSPSPSNAEEEFDELLDAGYVEIPSRGRRVRAFAGDFFGRGVLGGEIGFWQLAGHGVFSYELIGVKVGTGNVAAQAFQQIGKDIWSIGPQGIISLSASDQFGDLTSNRPSVPIQNLWNSDVDSGDFINRTFIDKSRLAYNASNGLVTIGLPFIQDQSAQQIIAYSVNTQKFYGPWPVDCQAMAAVELASPVTEVTMVGGSSGQVGYFNPFTRTDYGTTGYEMELETAALNGRSIDARVIGLNKTWRQLRFYILPRGDWDYTITYWTDTNPEEYTITKKQLERITNAAYVLNTDFRLDIDPDAFLRAGQDLIMATVDIDVEGHDLVVNIKQSGTGEDLAIQGLEVAAAAMGYEGD